MQVQILSYPPTRCSSVGWSSPLITGRPAVQFRPPRRISCPCSSARIERGPTKAGVAGSNPVRGTTHAHHKGMEVGDAPAISGYGADWVARRSGGPEAGGSSPSIPTHLGMAQLGSARRPGRRGRRFKSGYPDQELSPLRPGDSRRCRRPYPGKSVHAAERSLGAYWEERATGCSASGRALALGARGCRFESGQPDARWRMSLQWSHACVKLISMGRYTAGEMRAYMSDYRDRRRAWARALLGGKCVVCGTTEGLEFDHIDPETKTMSIGKMWHASKARLELELTKCQLLCSTHHDEKSRREGSLSRGGSRPRPGGTAAFVCASCGAPGTRKTSRVRSENQFCNRSCANRFNGGASRKPAPATVSKTVGGNSRSGSTPLSSANRR